MTRPRLMLYAGLTAFALVGLVASLFYEAGVEATRLQMYAPEPVIPEPEFAEMYPTTLDGFGGVVSRFDADQWIRSMWRACNAGDLEADASWRPPPPTPHGQMYLAACVALAGQIERARDIIDALPEANRTEAAGVLSTATFPAARQERYEVAGPAMELVLEHWPTMEGAIFHAGRGRLATGDLDGARDYLLRYVATTTSGTVPDLQRAWARELLARIDSASAVGAPPAR
jgi:hypothetical protein